MKANGLKTWMFASCLALLLVTQTFFYIQARNEFDHDTAYQTKYSEYSILIEVEDKALYLLQGGKCIKKYPIAAGKPETPSPLGSWRIVDKSDWGEGFGGRWLGLNVPWGT